ncbi:MAG: glycine--tRNA ligase, partial [Candidatus Norongarragalinales archaeon]
IAPRNFVFRCREFTQMEIEYFVHPQKMNDCPLLSPELLDARLPLYTQKNQEEKTAASQETVRAALDAGIIGSRWHAYWLAECFTFLRLLGLKKEKLRARQHLKDELSHYSSETWDLEYEYPWGWKELHGIANRGDFDLSQHAKHSGKDLSFFDQAANEKVVPRVIEPSWGVDRLLFTLLIDAFTEKPPAKQGGEPRVVLSLSPRVAPVQVAVFPLVSKDELPAKARSVFEDLRSCYSCEFDESGSIGRRYARQDEVGTPLCVTIDYQTLEDDTVTVRDRDSGAQERVKASDLRAVVWRKLGL